MSKYRSDAKRAFEQVFIGFTVEVLDEDKEDMNFSPVVLRPYQQQAQEMCAGRNPLLVVEELLAIICKNNR